MSSYENVVGGKLKLKGKALDVKTGMKKKKHKKHYDQISLASESELPAGRSIGMSRDLNQGDVNNADKSTGEGNAASYKLLLEEIGDKVHFIIRT